jgi:cysteinyl-tRNA synthetase
MNLPQALSLLDQGAGRLSLQEFNQIGQILGLTFQPKKTILTRQQKEMIRQRERLRRQKRYHQADRLRQELRRQGIKIDDTPAGSRVNEKV